MDEKKQPSEQEILNEIAGPLEALAKLGRKGAEPSEAVTEQLEAAETAAAETVEAVAEAAEAPTEVLSEAAEAPTEVLP